MIIVIIISIILVFFAIGNILRCKSLVKLFTTDNVLVFGPKGSGKDMLFSYVCRKRGLRYHSNVDYGGRYIAFKPSSDFSVGGNTCHNFITECINPYDYPYDDNEDYYISDCGVYFPSQEYTTLNKYYPSVPVFAALSRHLGDCRVHINVQAPNRVWDKLREQCTLYIGMTSTRVFFKRWCRQVGYIYTDYDTACKRVELDIRKGLGRKRREHYEDMVARFGKIRKFKIWHRVYKYDDRRFKSILKSKKYEVSVHEE